LAIEIRVESSWETDDGEGRSVEVSVLERRNPWEDPEEDTTWFCGGDRQRLKEFLCRLIDERAERFHGGERRECRTCGRATRTDSVDRDFYCSDCAAR
jgi:hypothetical protein